MGLVFKIVNATLPSMPSIPAYLTKYLQKVSDSHNTRESVNNDLVPPTHKTNMGKFSFYSTATQVWNSLTPPLKKCRSLASFKTALKIHLSGGLYIQYGVFSVDIELFGAILYVYELKPRYLNGNKTARTFLDEK